MVSFLKMSVFNVSISCASFYWGVIVTSSSCVISIKLISSWSRLCALWNKHLVKRETNRQTIMILTIIASHNCKHHLIEITLPFLISSLPSSSCSAIQLLRFSWCWLVVAAVVWCQLVFPLAAGCAMPKSLLLQAVCSLVYWSKLLHFLIPKQSGKNDPPVLVSSIRYSRPKRAAAIKTQAKEAIVHYSLLSFCCKNIFWHRPECLSFPHTSDGCHIYRNFHICQDCLILENAPSTQ